MGHLHGVARPAGWNLKAKAALASALLSVLFLVVYGGCNFLTALRADVGTWFYEWERAIPFVPLMIIPYMSIDLFFISAPFLCLDRKELAIHCRRVVFATLFAGACFLLFPLRLALDRPVADGLLGVIFDAFRGMDQPHNLFPSLHIAFCLIVGEVFLRRTRGLLRVSIFVWFVLIFFSTVLTLQHHVVDLVGGLILGSLCFYLFSEAPWVLPVAPNYRVGAFYGLGSALLGILAWASWPWGALALWPLLAMLIVTCGYFGLGPGIYRKHAGRLPLAARIFLGPVLFGQYVSLLYYRRQCNPWDDAAPGVWIGRKLNAGEAEQAIRHGVTAVLDLTAEFSEAAPLCTPLATREESCCAITYRALPILDLTAPNAEQLREAAEFIAEQSARGIVFVHCKAGYSRSAAAIGAYLLASGLAGSVAEAVAMLRTARPAIIIRPEVAAALEQFQASDFLRATCVGKSSNRAEGMLACPSNAALAG